MSWPRVEALPLIEGGRELALSNLLRRAGASWTHQERRRADFTPGRST